MLLYVYVLQICCFMTLPVSGFLVPAVGAGGHTGHCLVVLLEGLEKASSLTGLLGDLCHSLDNRGSASPLVLNTGMTHSSQAYRILQKTCNSVSCLAENFQIWDVMLNIRY